MSEVELDAADAARLAAHPGEGAFPSEKLAALPHAARVLLAVGPEGGWTDAELSACDAAGCHRVTLGPRVLRTETAGLVALAVLQARWGDL